MREKKKKTIAYMVSYSSIFIQGPWRNSIKLFSEKKGYKIIIYQFRDRRIDKTDPITKHQIIHVPYPFICTLFMYVFKSFFRLFKYVKLYKFSKIGDSIDYFIKGYYYVLFALFQKELRNADILIVGDPPAMVAAKYLSKLSNKKIVLWQLELLLTKELNNAAQRYFKKLEIRESSNIICGLEFGEKRAEIFREENKIPSNIPILTIPNAPIGKPKIRRNYYFNDYFDIPYEEIIVLAAGGVLNEFNEKMRAFCKSVERWPNNWVFVMHSNSKIYSFFSKVIPKKVLNEKIFIHDKPLPFSQINVIYSSCDMGLIPIRFEGKINNNLYYSELSLGKIFHFTKNGIPLISRNLYGYKSLIEGNGIGYTFNYINEIKTLVEKVVKNKNKIKSNCIQFNNKYNFEKYHNKLENIINKF